MFFSYVHNLICSFFLLWFIFLCKLSSKLTCLAVENSASDNLKSSAVIPQPTVLDRVLKDLFHEGVWLYLRHNYLVLLSIVKNELHAAFSFRVINYLSCPTLSP